MKTLELAAIAAGVYWLWHHRDHTTDTTHAATLPGPAPAQTPLVSLPAIVNTRLPVVPVSPVAVAKAPAAPSPTRIAMSTARSAPGSPAVRSAATSTAHSALSATKFAHAQTILAQMQANGASPEEIAQQQRLVAMFGNQVTAFSARAGRATARAARTAAAIAAGPRNARDATVEAHTTIAQAQRSRQMNTPTNPGQQGDAINAYKDAYSKWFFAKQRGAAVIPPKPAPLVIAVGPHAGATFQGDESKNYVTYLYSDDVPNHAAGGSGEGGRTSKPTHTRG